jgi:hypothetical protein
MAAQVSIYPAAAQRQLNLQTCDTKLEAGYPASSLLKLSDSQGRQTEQWLLAEAVNGLYLPDTIRITGLRDGDLLNITYPLAYGASAFLNKAPIDFPAGSLLRLANGNSTTLKQDLPQNGLLTPAMLTDAQAFKEGDQVALIHPDILLLTDLWDNQGGGYTAKADYLCEGLALAKGIVLECSQSKTKAELDSFTIDDDYTVTLKFKEPNNGTIKLSQPDGQTFSIPITVTASKPITDTVYLKEQELTTPGLIDIKIIQLPNLNSRLSTLNTQISTINSQLSTLNSQLSALNSQLSTLNY